jgi:hypothetical protein
MCTQETIAVTNHRYLWSHCGAEVREKAILKKKDISTTTSQLQPLVILPGRVTEPLPVRRLTRFCFSVHPNAEDIGPMIWNQIHEGLSASRGPMTTDYYLAEALAFV